ncbi:hypothetical protein EDD11_000580 [Mortierella claussenii]|nr:hypothetical protein EDD11_000580 [Mortierella claussenii]
MWSLRPGKNQRQSVKASVKSIEQDYKTKVQDAEKKCNALCKEADKTAERERAVIRAKREKAEKEAKDEFQQVKTEAGDMYVHSVIELVSNVVLDIKSRNLGLAAASGHINGTEISKDHSSSSSLTSSAIKEDAEIKEWVEYAAERLGCYMPKNQARQRLLEEIASGALIRQLQAQEEAQRKTGDLQRQLQQLQLLHQQQQQQQQQQQGGQGQQDVAPPAYAAAIVDASDSSVCETKKR